MNPPTLAKPSGKSASIPVCRIAIVEDMQETRRSLIRLLRSFAEFDCVCSCATGEEALKEIPPVRPDVILMDIFLPRMSGIECTARLKMLLPDTRILILTATNDVDKIFPALEAGADGYLLKHVELSRLRAALLDVVSGGFPMTGGIARRVAAYFRDRAKHREQIVHLGPREKELLALISKGYSNKEIAAQLSLSYDTIRCYLKDIYEKLHVRSRSEAVVKYMTSERG